MKPALLIILSFLLFALPTKLPLASAAEQVLDINGDPLDPGSQYYVVSAIWGAGGGGLRYGMHSNDNPSCPTTVFQARSDMDYGVPVKFRTRGRSPGNIATGTPLEIAFTKKPGCAESSKWVFVSGQLSKVWLGIGGPEDHAGNDLSSGYFKIENSGIAYKLTFCPTAVKPSCFNVVRLSDDEGMRLTLSTDQFPFLVVFINADKAGAGKYLKSMV